MFIRSLYLESGSSRSRLTTTWSNVAAAAVHFSVALAFARFGVWCRSRKRLRHVKERGVSNTPRGALLLICQCRSSIRRDMYVFISNKHETRRNYIQPLFPSASAITF